MRLLARLLKSALRWEVSRPKRRAFTLCRISILSRLRHLAALRPTQHLAAFGRLLIQLFRRPVIELGSKLKDHPIEDLFDFFERLTPKVLRLEKLRFGLLHQVTDVLDTGSLKAVETADRKLEIFDRLKQVLVELGRIFFDDFGRLNGLIEVDEDRHLLLDDLGGVSHRVLGQHAAVGPDLKGKFVVVGTLSDARVGDLVVHLANRAEQTVDGDDAKAVFFRLVLISGDVAVAGVDGKLHTKLAVLTDGSDEVIGVKNFNVMSGLKISLGHF